MANTVTTKYGTRINVAGLSPEQVQRVLSVGQDNGAYGAKAAALAATLQKRGSPTTAANATLDPSPMTTPAAGMAGSGGTAPDAPPIANAASTGQAFTQGMGAGTTDTTTPAATTLATTIPAATTTSQTGGVDTVATTNPVPAAPIRYPDPGTMLRQLHAANPKTAGLRYGPEQLKAAWAKLQAGRPARNPGNPAGPGNTADPANMGIDPATGQITPGAAIGGAKDFAQTGQTDAQRAAYDFITKDYATQKQQDVEDKKQELAQRGIPISADPNSLWMKSLNNIDTHYQNLYDQAKNQAITEGATVQNANTNAFSSFMSGLIGMSDAELKKYGIDKDTMVKLRDIADRYHRGAGASAGSTDQFMGGTAQ
jgi:hypothetical protein